MSTHLLCVCLLAAAGFTGAEAATLTLDQAALAGLPNATVGWGFTIVSTPIDDGGHTITPWLLITSADFVPNAGTNPVGVFTAFITQLPNSNTVIGPDASNGEVNPWTQAFDAVAFTGIGSYHINDFQALGDRVDGSILLHYDVFRTSPNDPAFDPSVDTVAVGQSISAFASATVGVPEPGTGSLLLVASCLFAATAGLRRLIRAPGD